ncbi:MAG: hypothetical protein HQK50_15020 [Oligoflexia bacterium]|nr:hypothetical protein [Oligoflexia bacterium]MBF0366884.1 hypothetical protein [Oligoflexia bacterium]
MRALTFTSTFTMLYTLLLLLLFTVPYVDSEKYRIGVRDFFRERAGESIPPPPALRELRASNARNFSYSASAEESWEYFHEFIVRAYPIRGDRRCLPKQQQKTLFTTGEVSIASCF